MSKRRKKRKADPYIQTKPRAYETFPGGVSKEHEDKRTKQNKKVDKEIVRDYQND